MIEEEALVAIIERFLEQLDDVAGVEPVENVQILYHDPEDEVLDFARFKSGSRTVLIGAELVERGATEGGRWRDLTIHAAYHEWGHALATLIEQNVGDAPMHGLDPRDIVEGKIEGLGSKFVPVDRETLVEAVENLHDAGLFQYSDLIVPYDDQIRSAEEFVAHIEEFGLREPVRGQNEIVDPLGHSLGDSIGEHAVDVAREDLQAGIIDLANELNLISSTGLNANDPEHVERLEEMMDVPDADLVRVTYPEVDSEGEEVLVETDGVLRGSPPRYRIELEMSKQRIFEGDEITFPNSPTGVFQGRVLDVEPESGARVAEDTEVEWVKES